MTHGREKNNSSLNTFVTKWCFANGRPVVGFARQKVGAAAELNCSVNRREEVEMPEGEYRKNETGV